MNGTIDEVGSALKIIDKCILVIVLTLATIIFLPQEAAESTGISKVRDEYFGYLWIGLIFSSLYMVRNFVKSFIDKRISKGQELKILEIGREQDRLDKKAAFELDEQKNAIRKNERFQHYKLLFSALSANELNWVRYCVIKNQMTVNTHKGNATANSLELKNLVVHGSGQLHWLPYSFQAEAWEFIVTNKALFISELELNSNNLQKELLAFETTLPLHF